jgi:hypothetical protein
LRLAGWLYGAQRIDLGQQVVGLRIEGGHALVLQGLIGLLVLPALALLELADLGLHLRDLLGVELAQLRACPVHGLAEVLLAAGCRSRKCPPAAQQSCGHQGRHDEASHGLARCRIVGAYLESDLGKKRPVFNHLPQKR